MPYFVIVSWTVFAAGPSFASLSCFAYSLLTRAPLAEMGSMGAVGVGGAFGGLCPLGACIFCGSILSAIYKIGAARFPEILHLSLLESLGHCSPFIAPKLSVPFDLLRGGAVQDKAPLYEAIEDFRFVRDSLRRGKMLAQAQ